MSSKALLWSRIALCFISVAFLLLYTSQYSTYRMQYSKILQKYSESVVHSDGLAAQLRGQLNFFVSVIIVFNFYLLTRESR